MKTELKFGVLSGLGISACIFLEYLSGLHNSGSILSNFTIYLPSITGMIIFFWGLRSKRDKILKGKMTFIQGIKSGSLISFISGLITVSYLWSYHHFINPSFIPRSVSEEKRKLIEEGLSEMLINRKIHDYLEMNSDLSLFTSKLFIFFILGLAVSAIFSAGLRNHRVERKSNEYLDRKP